MVKKISFILILTFFGCSTTAPPTPIQNRSVASISSAFNSCRTILRNLFFAPKNLVNEGQIAKFSNVNGAWRWRYIQYSDYYVDANGSIFANGSALLPDEKVIPPGHRFNVFKGKRGGNFTMIANGSPINMPISAQSSRIEVKLAANSKYIMYPGGRQLYIFNGTKTQGHKVRLLQGGGWSHFKNGVLSIFDKSGNLISTND